MAYKTIRYEVSDNRVTAAAHNRADRLWTANSSRRWFGWSSMKSPGTVPRTRMRRKAGYVRYRRLAMKRISLVDALFLCAETPETPMLEAHFFDGGAAGKEVKK